MKVRLLLLLLIFSLFSCSEDSGSSPLKGFIDKGSVKDGIYTNKHFGWSIKLPQKWEVDYSSEGIKEIMEIGSEFSDEAGYARSVEKYIKLFFVQKNDSTFTSFAVKITEENDVSIEEKINKLERQTRKVYKTILGSSGLIDLKANEGNLSGQRCGIVKCSILISDEVVCETLQYVFKRNGYWLYISAHYEPIESDDVYRSIVECTFTDG